MKKLIRYLALTAVLMVVTAFVVPAIAATMDGDIARYEALTDANWTRAFIDQSTYGRFGQPTTLVRFYRFDTDGTLSNQTFSLERGNYQTTVPDNLVIWDGFIDVIEPVLPLTTTNSLGIGDNTADILALTTNLNSTGLKAIIPVGTAATAVKTTNAAAFNFVTDDTQAITQGMFYVIMHCYKGL